jgi:RimJ/RimL family protein N-acetyltransferase
VRRNTGPKPDRLELRGPGVYLLPVTLRDADSLYRHIRDKAIAEWTAGIPYPYPRAAMTQFLRRAIRMMRAGERFVFAIRRYDDEEPVGVVDLHNLNLELRSAEIGYWLGRAFWNRGIMTQAVKLLLGFAFDRLKLHRVLVRHFEGNEASRRVIEKCWFRREGLEREVLHRRGRWHDLIRYGLLEQEYRAIGSGAGLARTGRNVERSALNAAGRGRGPDQPVKLGVAVRRRR